MVNDDWFCQREQAIRNVELFSGRYQYIHPTRCRFDLFIHDGDENNAYLLFIYLLPLATP